MDTNSFNFFTPTKLIFGSGSLKNLKQIAPLYGKKCLLVSRPKDGSLKAIYKQIDTLLDSTGVSVSFFDEIVPNPTLEGINRGVKIASENKVDFVLGVGGGSVMDSAKLIALLYESNGIVNWNNAFSNYNHPFEYIASKNSSLPFIAVSTTSGTGSQCTQAAVVSDTKNKEKITLFHRDLFPKVAIIDPKLMLSVPSRVTAATGFDAFTHAFESYLGQRTSPLTEYLSLETIRLVVEYLPKAIQKPDSIEYRTKLAWADTAAGICLSNGGADLPHPLGEIIGGICQRIAHGETLAIVYPAFLEYKEKIAAEKFRNIASYLGIEKTPKALTNEVIGLLKTTDLIRSKSRAAITLNEQAEILSHPLLKKLDPKNSEKILSIMSQSIEE